MDHSRVRERNLTANRADVRRVALELMERSGFGGTTVTLIAGTAGVSPSTVYRYFGTKEAIVVSGDECERLLATVAAAPRGASPAELFRRAAAEVFGTLDEVELRRRLRLVFADESLTTAFEHDVLAHRHRLGELFAERRGAKRTGLRDVGLAGALLGLVVAVLERWQRADGGKSLVAMLDKSIGRLT